MTTLIEGDRLKLGVQEIVSSISKHQMTVLSPTQTVLTGTVAGQVIALPSALTLTPGWVFSFVNLSSVAVHIKDFLGSPLVRLLPEEKLEATLLANDSSQGKWSLSQIPINNHVTNALFNIPFVGNGLAKGKWLNAHHGVDSSKMPAVMPFEVSQLIGMSFANTQEKASGNIKIYKNGISDLNVFQDINIIEQKTLGLTFKNDLMLKKGDTVSVYINAISGSGATADSPMATLFFKVVRP